MPSALELIHNGATRIRRICWQADAYLEVKGIWATLHDPMSYAALEACAREEDGPMPKLPYVLCVFLLPWEGDDFEVVE